MVPHINTTSGQCTTTATISLANQLRSTNDDVRVLHPRYSFSFISRNPGLTNISSVMVSCRQPDMSLPMNLRTRSHLVESSISVRCSSKVVTVCGSNWIRPSFCRRRFCFRSTLRCRTHPRSPHGSWQDIRTMSSAICRSRLAGTRNLQWRMH